MPGCPRDEEKRLKKSRLSEKQVAYAPRVADVPPSGIHFFVFAVFVLLQFRCTVWQAGNSRHVPSVNPV